VGTGAGIRVPGYPPSTSDGDLNTSLCLLPAIARTKVGIEWEYCTRYRLIAARTNEMSD
jgi:hypothetical protein